MRSKRQEFTDLCTEQDQLIQDMRAILDKAERESRDLRPDESKKYDKKGQELDVLSRKVRDLQADLFEGDALARDVALPATARAVDGRAINGGAGEDARGAAVLGREQRMASWAEDRTDRSGFSPSDAADFSLGNIMRAMVDPQFRSELTDVEQRALQVGVDAQGGFITPEPLSVNFIDRVRNQMQVMAAGAQTVPLDSDRQSIPRISADPTGAWRNENAAFAESQPAFERVVFTPQSYGFIVKTSEELYQDAVPGSGQVIENAITQTAALELDRAALRGTGTAPEPRGVLNQSGVTKLTLGAPNGATPTRYTEVMTAITALLGANRPPTGIIMAPRTAQFYAGLTDTTNQPLNPPQPVADIGRYITAQIPTNITKGTSSDTSEVYVADWRDLLIGIRLGIQLRLLTERYADNGQYAWRVFLRADVQLAHPESFYVIEGVRP